MKHPSILNPELKKKARYYLVYSTSNKYDVLEKSSWNDENERRKQIWMNSILIYVLETTCPPWFTEIGCQVALMDIIAVYLSLIFNHSR